MKSKDIIKNHVKFKGEFKKEFKDEFPGRDLAKFIAEQIRQKNYVVNSVEYEELWFTVNVVSGSIEYPLMVSHSAMEDDYWEISCPRTLRFFARLRGKSEDTELQNLVNVLDEILQDEKTITDIKWYSDYPDLANDYVKMPGAKRLGTVGKYLYKSFLPLCAIGMILIIVGSVRYDDKKNLLLVLGTILFLLPFASYFGFLAIGFLWSLINDIRETYRKRLKKKWFTWFFTLLIPSMIIVPFILGILHIPSVDRVMPTIQKYVFRFCVLLLFCGILFGLFCGILSGVQKQRERKRKILFVIGFVLILFGVIGFLGGCLSSLGVLNWIPKNIEFPLANIDSIDVDRGGNLFVLVRFYGRVQVYDQNGNFVRGWFFYAPSGEVQMKVNDQNEVEIAAFGSDKIYLFNENGKLLKTNKYEEIDSWYSSEDRKKHLFNKSTGLQYDVKGLVFPKIIQTSPEGEKKIGKNAFYLFPFQGPFQGLATAVVGMTIVNKLEKKRKKKRKKKLS